MDEIGAILTEACVNNTSEGKMGSRSPKDDPLPPRAECLRFSYQEECVIPGISPDNANSRKLSRHIPNFL